MGQWPVYFLLIFIVAFSNIDKYSATVPRNERNPGTVLFEKSTSCNHCWTKEELVILSSRKAFQDLLPETNPTNMQSNQYIIDLLNFLDTCLEHVCNMSFGKTKHLIMRSFADAAGSYLHTYVEPIVKVAFYSGNVDYRYVKRLFELTSEFRNFLRTNGAGWAKPVTVEMFINVTAVRITGKNSSACDVLIVNSGASKSYIESKNSAGRRRRKGLRRRSTTLRSVEKDNHSSAHQTDSFVFLPYFDNNSEPNSIALPFKDKNLWSLYDEESVPVLSKYYETCVRCILSRDDGKKILAKFHEDLQGWLLQSVYPRLSDEKLYPAFGGVLKILASINDFDGNEIVQPDQELSQNTPNDDTDVLGTWQLIFIAISTAALVWFIVGLMLVCYKCHQQRSQKSEETPSEKESYCDPSNCPRLNRESANDDKAMGWWKQKFTSTPAKCSQVREHRPCCNMFRDKETIIKHDIGRRVYKKRRKNRRLLSSSDSPGSSQCVYYENKHFHCTDLSSTGSENSSRR